MIKEEYEDEDEDEDEEAVYYCKQCGWIGKSSELIVANGWYEDYPPFFCPNCMADEYDLYDLEEGDLELTFWDKLRMPAWMQLLLYEALG